MAQEFRKYKCNRCTSLRPVTTAHIAATVERVIREEERWVTIDEMDETLSISHGSAY